MRRNGPELAARIRTRWRLVELVSAVVGGLVVLSFLHALHAAHDPAHGTADAIGGVVQLFAYLGIALPLGWVWRERRSRPLWRWLSEERPPSPAERDFVLRECQREIVPPATVWGLAALLAAAYGATDPSGHGFESLVAVTLGGLTTCALICLVTERLLRPVTARALAHEPPERPVGLGLQDRLVTVWSMASGVPLIGLALLAITALGGSGGAESLAVPILVVTAAALAAGSIATVLTARSLAEPVGAVRQALARVHAGDFDVHVTVDDASEVGLLEAGFNEMAAGLRERERLRDLFGRHVGEEVARRALRAGVALGGEVREVAALFVDLAGYTSVASRRPPQEVVSCLNRFFAIVVDVVEAHGGWVNKFEGDAALCVFGAPVEHPEAAGMALASGRVLAERLRAELPEFDVGIGISAGPAVAGNVGAVRRLEYTVVGDPVNEAARLCELAKRTPGQVLASGAALARAPAQELAQWQAGEETVLRGRSTPTRLVAPLVERPRELAPAGQAPDASSR